MKEIPALLRGCHTEITCDKCGAYMMSDKNTAKLICEEEDLLEKIRDSYSRMNDGRLGCVKRETAQEEIIELLPQFLELFEKNERKVAAGKILYAQISLARHMFDREINSVLNEYDLRTVERCSTQRKSKTGY